MFFTLVEYWREYMDSRKRKGYDPDRVQALGMRFCQEWKRNKENIMREFELKEEEFDYSLHHELMPKIALKVET